MSNEATVSNAEIDAADDYFRSVGGNHLPGGFFWTECLSAAKRAAAAPSASPDLLREAAQRIVNSPVDPRVGGRLILERDILALEAALRSATPGVEPTRLRDSLRGALETIRFIADSNKEWPRFHAGALEQIGATAAAALNSKPSAPTTVPIPPENGTPVRCPECNWAGRADELGRGGECGGDETCTGRPAEITSHADMIRAWWDSEGQICGKQLADAGMIAPRPATEAEIADRDLESGDTIWDLTPAGEATLQSEAPTDAK